MGEDRAGAAHDAPIIIKKVHKGHHGHHGGAWKVAYADMVTALMALFIVLWILSQSDEVIQSVAGYFRDPMGYKEGGMPSVFQGGANSGIELQAPEAEKPPSKEDTQAEERRWRERAERIRSALAEVPEFEKYRDQVEISLTPEGLRVTLVESTEDPIFQVGGTAIHPEARRLMQELGREIARLPNHIAIEGHTDSRPFAAGASDTNFELSSGRANEARRLLETAGIAPDRIFEVRGLADRQLYNPLDPEDSRNRRVSLTLLSPEAHAARQQSGDASQLLPDSLARD
jgi:chemotaxis protein MotB